MSDTKCCNKCGKSLKRLMLLAMLQDAGATVIPSANNCSAGGEHDFEEKKESDE